MANVDQNNLIFYRGDDLAFNFEFTDSNGSEVPITGWTIFFTVKRSKDDADVKAVLKKDFTTFTDPTHGKTTLTVSNTETNNIAGSYFYDFQVKNASGLITTLVSGNITFELDVTRRTSAI